MNTFGFVLYFVMVLAVQVAAGEEADERTALIEQRKSLQASIAALTEEQGFLVFQRTMYSTDAKYLVLNLSKKSGRLLYRNRILKDFHYTESKRFSGEHIKPGMLVLTKKSEGAQGRNALVFGNALILQWRRASVPPLEVKIPFITVTKKEMQSLFFAVEEGALAYVIR